MPDAVTVAGDTNLRALVLTNLRIRTEITPVTTRLAYEVDIAVS